MRRQRSADPDGAPDEGVTLVETLVAMSVFTVVVAVFMAAVVTMTSTTSRVGATADAGDGVRKVFLTMDRQVRYADAINRPGQGTSGGWYVEFRTTQRPDGQPDLCTQWRVDRASGSVQYRTWDDGQTPPTAWRTASTRVQDPVTAPFVVTPASATQLNQKLTVVLKAAAGTGASAGQASIQTSFVARNSSMSSPTNAAGVSVCPQATRP